MDRFKERDAIRKEVLEHRDALRKLRDDFNEKRKEWQNYLRQQKEIKQKEWLERKAARQAECTRHAAAARRAAAQAHLPRDQSATRE